MLMAKAEEDPEEASADEMLHPLPLSVRVDVQPDGRLVPPPSKDSARRIPNSPIVKLSGIFRRTPPSAVALRSRRKVSPQAPSSPKTKARVADSEGPMVP